MIWTGALEPAAWTWFSVGLAVAFLITIICIIVFMLFSQIDHGFLGLILLLTLIFFLIAFSFLVAASAQGVDIKIAVAIVDAFVVLGSKLLSDRFLQYLETELTEAALYRAHP
jgi:FtsH-binding integral membrane protein